MSHVWNDGVFVRYVRVGVLLGLSQVALVMVAIGIGTTLPTPVVAAMIGDDSAYRPGTRILLVDANRALAVPRVLPIDYADSIQFVDELPYTALVFVAESVPLNTPAQLYEWDLQSGQLWTILETMPERPDGRITTVADYSPMASGDGRWWAVVDRGEKAVVAIDRLGILTNFSIPVELNAMPDEITDVSHTGHQFSPRGNYLILTRQAGLVLVDLTSRDTQTLDTGRLYDVQWTANDKWVLTISAEGNSQLVNEFDQSVQIFSVENGRRYAKLPATTMRAVSLSSCGEDDSGNLVIAAVEDGVQSLRTVSLATDNQEVVLEEIPDEVWSVTSVNWSPLCHYVEIKSSRFIDGIVHYFDMDTRHLVEVVVGDSASGWIWEWGTDDELYIYRLLPSYNGIPATKGIYRVSMTDGSWQENGRSPMMLGRPIWFSQFEKALFIGGNSPHAGIADLQNNSTRQITPPSIRIREIMLWEDTP